MQLTPVTASDLLGSEIWHEVLVRAHTLAFEEFILADSKEKAAEIIHANNASAYITRALQIEADKLHDEKP